MELAITQSYIQCMEPLLKDTWLIRTLDLVPTLYFCFSEIRNLSLIRTITLIPRVVRIREVPLYTTVALAHKLEEAEYDQQVHAVLAIQRLVWIQFHLCCAREVRTKFGLALQ